MPKEPVYQYDLFISYADADEEWVKGVLLHARAQAGVRCHTEAAFALGVPRLLEFERAIQQSQRTLLILSPSYEAEGFVRFVEWARLQSHLPPRPVLYAKEELKPAR